MRGKVTPLRGEQSDKAAEREATRSFTSWKLDILDALMSDDRITDGEFRVAFRVMQAVNAETRVAIISDETIKEEVPRTNRWKCNDARKKLSELGWWKVTSGHGGTASRYEFSIENRNAILDQRVAKKDARDAERVKRRSRDKRRKDNVVELPHKCTKRRGNSTTWDVAEVPPVHLQDTFTSSIKEEENGDRELAELLRSKHGFDVTF
jgi:hypothetical protein